jgi:sterol 3beta-glucosyltransferase
MNANAPLPWPPEFVRNLRNKPSFRIAALTWGSRGDVQPFAALGAELVQRGHKVILAAREPYRKLIEEQGIEFHPMPEDGTEDLMRTLSNSTGGLPSLVKTVSAYSRSLVRMQFQSFWEATEGADVILTKSVSTAPALHIAERRGLPVFLMHFDPGFLPTEKFCLDGDHVRDRGGRRNLFMGRMTLLPMSFTLWDKVNRWRTAQHMPVDWTAKWARPSYFSRFPAFVIWSPHMLARPSDWPEWFVQTGWLRLPRKTPVSLRLREFMAAGPPPVYIGFGSWGVHDKTEVTNILLEGLQATGNRAILLRNTVDDRSKFPDGILVEEELPHDWLFPRLKAAVHHGGAGTVGAVTTAGIPSIIIPAFPAQACWGNMILEKNIGTMLDRHTLSVEGLADALRWMDRPEVRGHASAMGALARRDGAEGLAADEIERRLREITGEPPPPSVWQVLDWFPKVEDNVPVRGEMAASRRSENPLRVAHPHRLF